MSLQQRFMFGILSGAGSVIIKTALNVLLIPVLLYFLGADYFGLYVLLIGLLEMSIMMDLGFSATIVKALGACRTSGNPEKGLQFLKVGHLLYIAIALVIAAIGFTISPLFISVFNLPAEIVPVAKVALVIVVIECALTLYTCYYRAVLMSHCMQQWANISDTVFNVMANLMGLFLLFQGYDLAAVLMARLAAAGLRLLIMVSKSVQLEPQVLLPQARVQFDTIRELSTLSFHSLVINLSIFVSHKIDTYVIALFLPLKLVGAYEIVFRFLGIALQICSKVCEGVFPLFAQMVALKQKGEMRHLFLRMSCFSNFVVCLILLLIVSFYSELFQLFSANKIPMGLTLPVLAIAVPTIWSGVLQIPAGYYLFVSGNQGFLSVTSFLAAAVNLLLSLMLVQSLGIVGVALGTLIPQVIQHQAFLIRKTCQELDISLWDYMRAVHLNILVPMAGAYAWILMIKPAIHLGELWISLALAAFTSLVIAGVLLVQFTATAEEKQLFMLNILDPLRRKLLPHLGGSHG